MAIQRLSEPFVWYAIVDDLKSMLRCRKQSSTNKLKYSKESLNSFINSAMNIEYVFIVLTGINFYLE